MHQTTASQPPFSTDGYFFSPLPFSHTDKIEALQLAIILGINKEVNSEVILIAQSNITQNTIYQLAMVGPVSIADKAGSTVDTDSLRQAPVEELSEQRLKENGWTIKCKPHFVWLKENKPLNQSKSYQIFSSAFSQLETLSRLTK